MSQFAFLRVELIEKQQRRILYADFEDEMGVETGVTLPGFGDGPDWAKFRAKAQGVPVRPSGSDRRSEAPDEQSAHDVRPG